MTSLLFGLWFPTHLESAPCRVFSLRLFNLVVSFEYPCRRQDKSSPSVPEPIIMEQTGVIDRGKQFEQTGRLTNIYQVATVWVSGDRQKGEGPTGGFGASHDRLVASLDGRLWVRGLSIRTLILGPGEPGWESDHATCKLWGLTLGWTRPQTALLPLMKSETKPVSVWPALFSGVHSLNPYKFSL